MQSLQVRLSVSWIWCWILLLRVTSLSDAACTDPGATCLNNGTCISGSCVCNASTWLSFRDARCDNVSTVTTSLTATEEVKTSTSYIRSGRVNFTATALQAGFPIGDGSIVTAMFICSNGYVTFGSAFCTSRLELLLTAGAPPFIAPFATSFDYRSSVDTFNSSARISYVVVSSVDSEPRLKSMRDSLSDLANTTAAIVVTWASLAPAPLDSRSTQNLTMQLIIFTDRQKATVGVMLYSENTVKHYFDWVPTFVAYKASSSATAVSLATTRSSAVAYATSRVSIGGGLKVTVRTVPLYRNNSAPVNSNAVCIDAAQAAMAVPVSAQVAASCPQTAQQARFDGRFALNATAASGRQAFNLSLTAGLEKVTQLSCVYHSATGGLLVQESAVRIVSAGISQGDSLYSSCCVSAPTLCLQYYARYPQPSSAAYSAPTHAGFVVGAGLFRTFDSQQFKYMTFGDLWLVSSAKLKIQIRMQSPDMMNSPANRTASVQALAVQFNGLTNLTVEVYWNNTLQLFNSWHYSVNQGPVQNMTSPNATVQTVVSNNGVIAANNSRLLSYTQDSATWIEVTSGSNGLAVTVLLNKTEILSISGPLGNVDGNATNDLAYRNGTVLSSAQQADIADALKTWAVPANESLFRAVSSPPAAPDASWSALYWNSAWDTNVTALTEGLFNSSNSTYNSSDAACSLKLPRTTENRHCLLEFAGCQQRNCSDAYLTRLGAVAASLLNLACTPPQWNATTTATPLTVKEGVNFTISLPSYVVGDVATRTFVKLNGPDSLSVSSNGNLTWLLPNQTEASTGSIVIGVQDASNCTSLWPVRVRLTRRDGLCSANAAERIGFTAATVNAVIPQNQLTVSACACSANFYGTNCSFSTCPLGCSVCDASSLSNCSATCPANFNSYNFSGVTTCAYLDRCNSAACVGSNYTACVSANPIYQTDTFKYQCSCTTPGYQYPLANPADKTQCEDTNECLNPLLCDLAKNRTCTNTPGNYTCSCSSGYTLSNGDCVDNDECKLNTTICGPGTCINTAGSYYCNCSTGYYQETSQKCTNINECASPAISKCTHTCTDTDGAFTCTCYSNFTHPPGDLVTCIPQYNCMNSSICPYSGLCTRVLNVTDTCSCPSWQTKTSATTCNATTSCQPGICGGGSCEEANPGYKCNCNQYYELNSTGVCVKRQYCNDTNRYPGVCPLGTNIACSTNATTNAPMCDCMSGFIRNSANYCVDINECLNATLNACDQSSSDCYNTYGGYTCNCRPGYKPLNSTICTAAAFVYQVNATFTDLDYSQDLANNVSDAFNRTADMLQKRIVNALPPDSMPASGAAGVPSVRIIAMASGSIKATSVASYATPTTPEAIKYAASAVGLAVDASSKVNECQSSLLNACSSEHNCVDTDAGYQCQCKIGFTQTGLRAGFPDTKQIADCLDVDECQLQCKEAFKTCVNTPGSYNCSCLNGTWSSDPKAFPCENPCTPTRCQNGGACLNQTSLRDSRVPYRCVCTAGYAGLNCESYDDNYVAMQRNAIIIGVVLGVLLLIALILVICFIIRKNQQTPTEQSRSLVPKRRDSLDHELTNISAASSAAVPPAAAEAAAAVSRRHEGNYKNTQAVPMADTSIPRAQESARHPSAYENQAYNRGNQRQQSSEYY